jgi:GTPase SAR1 family protein
MAFCEISLDGKCKIKIDTVLFKTALRALEDKHVILFGPPGVGKTSLANELLSCLEDKKYKTGIFNLSDETQFSVQFTQFFQKIDDLTIERDETATYTIDALFEYVQAHKQFKYAIAFENVDQLDILQSRLEVIKKLKNLKMIITTHNPQIMDESWSHGFKKFEWKAL